MSGNGNINNQDKSEYYSNQYNSQHHQQSTASNSITSLHQESNGKPDDKSHGNQTQQNNDPNNQIVQLINNNNTWKNHNIHLIKGSNSSIITGVSGQQLHQLVFHSNSNNKASETKGDNNLNQQVNGKLQSIGKENQQLTCVQNDQTSSEHMNSNGYGRGRMTGSSSSTNENLPWLANASTPSQSQQTQADSILAGHLQGQGQDRLSHPASSSASGYRTSVTMAEGSQRLLTGNQYLAGNSPYSPLYSIHGQHQHVSNVHSQYSAIYANPYNYPPEGSSLISPGQYPHIQSYSAVLASMGSHVQHGNPATPQSQLPRTTPFMSGTPMPQYSPMGSHRSLTSASSPGPLHPSGSYNPSSDTLIHGQRSPKVEAREGDRGHRSGTSTSSGLCDERSLGYSSGPLSGKSTGPLSSPRENDLFYKFPSGKEGSLKHRILKRPLDSPGDTEAETKYSRTEEHKRSKLVPSASSSVSGYSSHVSVGGAAESHVSGLAPGPSEPEEYEGLPPRHLHYPPHFKKGSIIQLANNKLKRVEDLETADFIQSADISPDLKIDSSTVIRIDEHVDRGSAILGFSVGEHKVKVTVEATLEHPFFVFHQGWTSCSPLASSQRYGLECHKLAINDKCVSLTHKDALLIASELGEQQDRTSPATSRQGQTTYCVAEPVRSSEGITSHSSMPVSSRPPVTTQDSYSRRQYSSSSTVTTTSESLDLNQIKSESSDKKQ